MGRWHNREYVDFAVEPIIQRANATKVLVKASGGKAKRTAVSEYFIEQTFIAAIKGDIKAHKMVLKWAKKHLLPLPKKQLPISKTRPITQADVDLWRKAGALPPNCPSILEQINLATLNKAYRAYKRNHPNTNFNERGIRGLRMHFRAFLANWSSTTH
jgi:hypothetical protein